MSDAPAQVDLGTDVDEGDEFNILDDSSGPSSVAELTRNILKGEGDSRDVDLASNQLLGDTDDPLADQFDHIEEEEGETVAETPTPDPVVSSPAAQAPTANDDLLWEILESNSGLSLRDKYATPKDAAAGLGHAARALGQRDEFAQIGRAIKENPEAAWEALGRQIGKVQSQEAPKPAAKEQVPQYDPSWQTFIDAESGEWKANTPPDVIREATAYQRWKQKNLEDLTTRFDEKVKEATKAELEARDKEIAAIKAQLAERDAMAQQSESQRQYFTTMHQHLAPHAKWIFNEGTQAKGLSESGMLLEAKIKELSGSIHDIPTLVRAAVNETALELAKKPAAQPAAVPNKDARTQNAQKITQQPVGNRKAAPSRARLQTADDLAKALKKLWQ